MDVSILIDVGMCSALSHSELSRQEVSAELRILAAEDGSNGTLCRLLESGPPEPSAPDEPLWREIFLDSSNDSGAMMPNP